MNGCMNVGMNGRMDGWMGGWTNGWMDGWMACGPLPATIPPTCYVCVWLRKIMGLHSRATPAMMRQGVVFCYAAFGLVGCWGMCEHIVFVQHVRGVVGTPRPGDLL